MLIAAGNKMTGFL